MSNIKQILMILTIFAMVGCTKEETPCEVVGAELCEVADTLSAWQVLQMAIVMTESEFKPDAIGKSEDTGIFQITPIYVKEFNRLTGENFTIEDALDIQKSIRMFSVVQAHYNPTQSDTKAIKLHNPRAAGWYEKKVRKNMEFIQRYETVRRELL